LSAGATVSQQRGSTFRYTTIYWYLEYLIGLAIKLKRDSAQHALLLVRMATRPATPLARGIGLR
jgi:hypothetical protein